MDLRLTKFHDSKFKIKITKLILKLDENDCTFTKDTLNLNRKNVKKRNKNNVKMGII